MLLIWIPRCGKITGYNAIILPEKDDRRQRIIVVTCGSVEVKVTASKGVGRKPRNRKEVCWHVLIVSNNLVESELKV